MAEWQLQDAKNRFSELVREARENGPQVVTIRGKRAVVVLSSAAFDAIERPRKPFNEFLMEGPAWPDDVIDAINDRSPDPGRDVEF